MKTSSIIIAYLFLSIIGLAAAYDAQGVGGNFGTSWLQQHGTVFATENRTSLWNWGDVPKGYTISDGNLYPPGFGTQWYYPDFMTSSTPVIINITAKNSSNYIPPYSLSPNFIYEDPWLLAQLTGRPVAVINTPKGPLF